MYRKNTVKTILVSLTETLIFSCHLNCYVNNLSLFNSNYNSYCLNFPFNSQLSR